MFRLRKKQMTAFSEAAILRFEDDMVRHAGRFFSDRCAQLGEDGVRAMIRGAIERAARYRIVSERGVCLYLNLMFVFGRELDRDPELPWAGRILNDPSIPYAAQRIDALYEEAMRHEAERDAQLGEGG